MGGKRVAAPVRRAPVKKRPKRRKKNPLRVLYRVLIVLSAIIVALYILWPHLFPDPTMSEHLPSGTHTDSPTFEQPNETGQPTGLQRKERCYTFLLVGCDDGNGNADTIMVATYDTEAQKVGVVSIPRDTLVDVQRTVKKINASYGAGGVEQVKQEVSTLLGVPIDFYLQVNLKAFVAIVDAVGGVDFYVPVDMNYVDPVGNLYIHFKKGTQHLDGEDAMKVVRFRKDNSGVGYSDLGRAETQRNLLKALAEKVLSWDSIPRITQFIDIFAQYVKTDLTVRDMVWFAERALQLDTANGVSMATLPGNPDTHYKGLRYYHGLYPQETLNIMNEMINPYTTDMTLDMMHIVVVDGYNNGK